jgi:hypothetical protein
VRYPILEAAIARGRVDWHSREAQSAGVRGSPAGNRPRGSIQGLHFSRPAAGEQLRVPVRERTRDARKQAQGHGSNQFGRIALATGVSPVRAVDGSSACEPPLAPKFTRTRSGTNVFAFQPSSFAVGGPFSMIGLLQFAARFGHARCLPFLAEMPRNYKREFITVTCPRRLGKRGGPVTCPGPPGPPELVRTRKPN